ncbi:hypothetical protein [Hymenobacter persicinus]|uniref:Uncharacterized protein n=1 Tax=Hymenobacter persicinus TaxID=2025506 RepID=A0A4V1ZAX5_9BACT|nr:hypothetical protein [Hymenobacter persicinus]RYU81009.1 hypothetical protein EWM57_07140 [Hymenobacter persicinus]
MKAFPVLTLLLTSALSSVAQAPRPRPAASTQTLIQGIWAASEDENAEFFVEGTRLTYVESLDRPLRYTVTPTRLTIFLVDGPYSCRIRKLTRDSLVYVTPYGFVVRLYKRK